MMKKRTVFVGLFLVLFGFGSAAFAQQGGFTGPSGQGTSGATRNYRTATVSQLQGIGGKSYVMLNGYVVGSVGGKHYTFRDDTGEVRVEIERSAWRGVTVSATDRVELLVEVERKRNGRIEVEAKSLRKI